MGTTSWRHFWIFWDPFLSLSFWYSSLASSRTSPLFIQWNVRQSFALGNILSHTKCATIGLFGLWFREGGLLIREFFRFTSASSSLADGQSRSDTSSRPFFIILQHVSSFIFEAPWSVEKLKHCFCIFSSLLFILCGSILFQSSNLPIFLHSGTVSRSPKAYTVQLLSGRKMV